MPLLEIACFNAESAKIACEAGADRIELCDGRDAGGTTPSFAPFLDTVEIGHRMSIPIFVMIRPRGGDFVYSDPEYQAMIYSIRTYKSRASGFVLGLLTPDRRVDIRRTRELVRVAHPLPCTFHRAFDDAKDLFDALEDIKATGCASILSSGGASTALHGSGMLSDLVKEARGRITMVIGGGVRSVNVGVLKSVTQAEAFHSSALLKGAEVPDRQEIASLRRELGLPLHHNNMDHEEQKL